MKKLWMVTAIAMAVSCNDDKAETSLAKCDYEFNLQCNENVVQQCTQQAEGLVWVAYQDCGATNQVCAQSDTVSAAVCIPPPPPGNEGEPCNPYTDCAAGLECIDDLCWRTCTPSNGAGCSSTQQCVAVDEQGSNGICLNNADLGDVCMLSEQCPGDNSMCEVVRYSASELPQGVCTENCSYADINKGHGTCGDDMYCVSSGSMVELQQPQTNCAGNADCNEAEGYQCLNLTSGKKCSRFIGICGNLLPLYGGLPNEVPPAEDLCGYMDPERDNRWFCGLSDPDATADVMCVSPIFADDDYLGICMAVCSSGEGADKNCGAGYQCSEPADAVFYDVQEVNGERVGCDKGSASPDAPCNVAAGFHCEKLNAGDLCARPSKLCTPVAP